MKREERPPPRRVSVTDYGGAKKNPLSLSDEGILYILFSLQTYIKKKGCPLDNPIFT